MDAARALSVYPGVAKGVVILLACLLCGGCVSPSKPVRPHQDYLCWSSNLSHGVPYWMEEAKSRFKDPYLVVVHGELGPPTWVAFADDPRRRGDLRMALWALHDTMPDRDLVIISCNEGSPPFELDIPRVWYCRRAVWSVPWWACWSEPRGACSIWEFVSEGRPAQPSTQPTSRSTLTTSRPS